MPTRQASANPIAIIRRRRWQNISTRGILRHLKNASVKIFLGKVWPMLQSDWSIQWFEDDSIERNHWIINSQLHKWSLRMCCQKSIGQWTSTPSLELKMTAINVRLTICHLTIKPHNKPELSKLDLLSSFSQSMESSWVCPSCWSLWAGSICLQMFAQHFRSPLTQKQWAFT